MNRPYLFPDNTVLCNFAAVDRLQLLQDTLDGRGRWVEAIAYEARTSSRHHPALSRIEYEGWLGVPIEIDTTAEIRQVETIRRTVFGGLARRPRAHLGEAQTCHVILNRAELRGSHWISDDQEAVCYASRQGIPTRQTAGLMQEAVARELIDPDKAWDVLVDMLQEERHIRMPATADELFG